MAQTKPNGLPFLWISLLVIILDQVTKYLCVNLIEYGTAGINVLPFFNLVHVYNFGAAFSFLADKSGWQRWFFAGLAIVIAVGFVYILKKTPKTHKWTCLAYALFIGGAIGNLIDRPSGGNALPNDRFNSRRVISGDFQKPLLQRPAAGKRVFNNQI